MLEEGGLMSITTFLKKILVILKGNKQINTKKKNKRNKISSESKDGKDVILSLIKQAQEISNEDHQKHLNNISSFDVNSIIQTDDKPLTAVEKAFLKYIAGRKVNDPYIAGYWSYEYKIDFNYILSKYINNNYLYIGNPDPHKLTISALKEILRLAGLPTSGKKLDLVERVNTLPTESYSTEQYYRLTEKGNEIVNSVEESATKDTAFEDEVLQLLYNRKIQEAAQAVFKYRKIRQPYGGTLSFYDIANDNDIQKYQNYYNSFSNKEASCIIFSCLMGFGFQSEKKLLKRILGKESIEKTKQYTLDAAIELKNSDSEDEYQIVCCLDDKTCSICGKMDLRHFKYKQAIVGKNFPPFHEGCRCITAPYFKDNITERVARDRNGKTIYVKGNMKWSKWKDLYGKKS